MKTRYKRFEALFNDGIRVSYSMKYFIIFLVLASLTVFMPHAFGSCVSLPCDDANIKLGESNYRFIDFSYANIIGEPIQFIVERTALGDCTSFNTEIINEDGNMAWGEGSFALCDPITKNQVSGIVQ